MNKMPFEINSEKKQFVFTSKNYRELFVENSAVNKAFKAAMALGCYEGFVPVEKDADKKDGKKVFTAAGVEEWIKLHNPDWLAKWEASAAVKMINGEPYPFMVRKNYFLYENEAARADANMAEIKKTKSNPEGVYQLKKNAVALKNAVEAYIKK